MRNITAPGIIAIIAALIIGFGAGYYIPHGTHAAKSQTRKDMRLAQGTNQASKEFLSGTVAKEDSESITVDTRDGNSHVVLITPATVVDKSVTGTTSDISLGSDVLVSGATNGDGSVSASLIQLRPAGVRGIPNGTNHR